MSPIVTAVVILATTSSTVIGEERNMYATLVLAVGAELVAGFDRARLDALLGLGRDGGAPR